MRKYLKFVFFLICVIFLQNSSYACGSSCNEVKNNTESRSQCCSKIEKNNSSKANCCISIKKKEKNGKCGGKCGNNSCNCVKIFSNFFITLNVTFQNKLLVTFFDKKQLYCNFNLNTSSGFYLIWTPPNI